MVLQHEVVQLDEGCREHPHRAVALVCSEVPTVIELGQIGHKIVLAEREFLVFRANLVREERWDAVERIL